MDKEKFVEGLFKLLKECDPQCGITNMYYHPTYYGEFVEVFWGDDYNMGIFTRRIDVTADSITAMMRDISRGIE